MYVHKSFIYLQYNISVLKFPLWYYLSSFLTTSCLQFSSTAFAVNYFLRAACLSFPPIAYLSVIFRSLLSSPHFSPSSPPPHSLSLSSHRLSSSVIFFLLLPLICLRCNVFQIAWLKEGKSKARREQDDTELIEKQNKKERGHVQRSKGGGGG